MIKNFTLRCDWLYLSGNVLTWPAAIASRLEKVAQRCLSYLSLLRGADISAISIYLLQRRISVVKACWVFGLKIPTQFCYVLIKVICLSSARWIISGYALNLRSLMATFVVLWSLSLNWRYIIGCIVSGRRLPLECLSNWVVGYWLCSKLCVRTSYYLRV